MQGIIFLIFILIAFSKFKEFAEKVGLELENEGETHFFNETPSGGFSNKKWYRNLAGSFTAKKAKGNIDRAMKILVPGKYTIEKLNSARSTANQEASRCLSNKNAAVFYSSLIKRINDETRKLAEQDLRGAKRKLAAKQRMDTTFSSEAPHPLLKALKNPHSVKQAIIMAEIIKRKE